jgi:hypothetical protein
MLLLSGTDFREIRNTEMILIYYTVVITEKLWKWYYRIAGVVTITDMTGWEETQ